MNQFEQGLKRYLNQKQLTRIRSVKVGIGGAGGLGSNLAVILTRSGFRYFEILDKDIVTASNLNRQNYFIRDIGKPKVFLLKKFLRRINPDIVILTHQALWHKALSRSFFRECSVVAEAFDGAPWKRDFAEAYQDRAQLVVSGNGMAGITVQKDLRVKRMGNLYIVGDGLTAAGPLTPPMAPRVIECAAKMGQIILDWALAAP